MKRLNKTAKVSIGVALFWASLVTGAAGQSGALDSIPVEADSQNEQSTTSPVSLARLAPLPSHGEFVDRQRGREKVFAHAPELWFKSGASLDELITVKQSLLQESVVSRWQPEVLPTSNGWLELWTW